MHNYKGILLKTLLPIAIGMAVILWLFLKEFNWEDWSKINWSGHVAICLFLAIVALCGREFGLMWRFRILSDNRLKWGSTLRVTLLCEFTSAVTPTTAGGSAVSMVFMSREGLSAGRATTITLTTFLFDEALFAILCPLIFIMAGKTALFGFDPTKTEDGIRAAYWIVWGGILLITFFLFLAILIRPELCRDTIRRLFSWKKLRRWSPKMEKLADEMLMSSKEIRHKSPKWWLTASAATIVSWASRFLIVNALFLAFAPYASQLVVFARQIVIWTLLTVSPTPGGSGVSEWLFTTYYGDLLSDVSVALIIAIFWRIITYYIYLILGVALLPRWLKQSKSPKNDS